MSVEPKYNDERYHIEFIDGVYHIVNIYGEKCFDRHGIMFWTLKQYAEHELSKINITPDGGIVTNFI